MEEGNQQGKFEDVAAFKHVDAEGYGQKGKKEYAETLVSEANAELAGFQSRLSKAGYAPEEDLILLSDPFYHEHELIHRLGSRIEGEEPREGLVPEDAERVVSEELAETYGMSVPDTAAYLVDDYSETAADLISDTVDDLMDVSVDGEDIVLDLDTDRMPDRNPQQEQLEEMVAHYLTEDLTRDSIGMMFGYGILPHTFRNTSRALEKLDKDSDYDKGVFARRALGHNSVRELQEKTEYMEDVDLLERSKLNGELNDEGLARLLFREFRNRL